MRMNNFEVPEFEWGKKNKAGEGERNQKKKEREVQLRIKAVDEVTKYNTAGSSSRLDGRRRSYMN